MLDLGDTIHDPQIAVAGADDVRAQKDTAKLWAVPVQ
jgi:hypothetical protein